MPHESRHPLQIATLCVAVTGSERCHFWSKLRRTARIVHCRLSHGLAVLSQQVNWSRKLATIPRKPVAAPCDTIGFSHASPRVHAIPCPYVHMYNGTYVQAASWAWKPKAAALSRTFGAFDSQSQRCDRGSPSATTYNYIPNMPWLG